MFFYRRNLSRYDRWCPNIHRANLSSPAHMSLLCERKRVYIYWECLTKCNICRKLSRNNQIRKRSHILRKHKSRDLLHLSKRLYRCNPHHSQHQFFIPFRIFFMEEQLILSAVFSMLGKKHFNSLLRCGGDMSYQKRKNLLCLHLIHLHRHQQ